MSSFLVSSYSLSTAPRSSVSRIQADLRIAQKEVTTGRFADVGLALGQRTSQAVSLRTEYESTNGLREANGLISQRFDVMQTALTSIAETAGAFLTSLIGNGTSTAGISATVQQAEAGLQQIVAALNTSAGSRFLFSGAATEQQAINFQAVGGGAASTYEDNSTAKQATADAFLAKFGFTQNDPAVGTISAADLGDFLDTEFEDLFALAPLPPGLGWANWSQADGTPVYNVIDGQSQIKVSYAADADAFRNMTKAYVMLGDLGALGMSEEARQLLTSRAVESLSAGMAQLTTMQSEIGASQARLERTDLSLKGRSTVLSMSITSIEEVDPYEASTRVTNLMNLLESSYALTARISRLSILNYL